VSERGQFLLSLDKRLDVLSTADSQVPSASLNLSVTVEERIKIAPEKRLSIAITSRQAIFQRNQFAERGDRSNTEQAIGNVGGRHSVLGMPSNESVGRPPRPSDGRMPDATKAVVVDQVLPDGDGVAPTRERVGDDLAIRLARARARGLAPADARGRWTPPGA
jgi:hypothetical protein